MFGCTDIFHSANGTFTSPYYPTTYLNTSQLECKWELNVDFGHLIQLQIIDLDIRRSSDCQFEKLKISNEKDKDEYTFCGLKENIKLTSIHNRLFVSFFIENSFGYRGFNISYKSVKKCMSQFFINNLISIII